jgi:hypothetical protein
MTTSYTTEINPLQIKAFHFQIVIKKNTRISECGLMLAIYIFQTKTKKIVT